MTQQQPAFPLRLLVADDDQSIRQLVCTIVRREHLDVDCVADGREAIESLHRNEYAVILLDLMMPRVDGFGVIEHLRAHPQSFKPVVIVMTAYADQKFKQVDPEIVAGLLRKPFDIVELTGVIRLFVDGLDDEMQRLFFSSDSALHTFGQGLAAARPWRGSGDGGNGRTAGGM